MRVLLVNPYLLSEDERESRSFHPYPPMGPLYVASALRQEGHHVEFLDAVFEPSIDGVVDAVRRSGAAVVGAYTTFLNRNNAIAVGKAARARGAFTIAGGPDANVEPGAYLDEAFDAVVMGEGEVTTLHLLSIVSRGGEWQGIPGLAWMEDDVVRMGPPRDPIVDVNTIDFPARDLADIPGYARRWRERHGHFALSIMSSRGCPYNCAFCSRPVFGRNVRRRSVANVVRELREIRHVHGADRVRFADDILPLDRRWMMDLLEAIRDEDLGLDFECLARADLVDEEMLAAMADVGFKEVFYGVESGSDRVLQAMNKGQTREEILRATTLTRKAGMVQHWFIMFGYPGETVEDVERTVEMILDVAPESISTTVVYPIKGTPLYENVKGLMTSGQWSRSDDVEMMFRNRYPARFYRWTVFRVNTSLRLRRFLGRRDSAALMAFDLMGRVVTKVLAVEDEVWSST
jgi:anaerobic magnesium-protoporphyrin IX monomethyl ester cyclase